MAIVLNEYDWAENAIQGYTLGRKPIETLGRVAKYYLYNGCSARDTKELLEAFLLQAVPGASLVKWSDSIDRAVKYAEKHPIAMIDGISITDTEIEKINTLKGKQQRRLAFTLLCLAKYYNKINPQQNYWVNTPDTEIMNLANINTSIKRQGLLYHQLRDEGFIRFSKKVDNLSVQVLFADDGNDVIYINDFRNIGNQYLMYMGEPYFACENCGLVTKIGNYDNPKGGRHTKYCTECAPLVNCKNRRKAVDRYQARQKINIIS